MDDRSKGMTETSLTALRFLHRWAGLIGLPFMIISILLAISLTHTNLLNWLSERLYDSLPIPDVSLSEPIEPGSWDQAIEVARLAVGARGSVITSRDDDRVVVQSFMAHSHDPQAMRINPHTQVLIDTRTMKILRIQDKSTSLVSQGHAIHAFRFFDMEYFSIALVTSCALLVLLVTGGILAWSDRKAQSVYASPLFWHVRLGQGIGILILVIVMTTLNIEFDFFNSRDSVASHPIPKMQLSGPLRPGSIDQARELAANATGSLPRAVFIRADGDDVKFSEAGDGIGGKSVWMNANSMTINRITDWRNDRQAFSFILHDGRWLGGMNALNVNDIAALILLWLLLGGVGLYVAKRRKA